MWSLSSSAAASSSLFVYAAAILLFTVLIAQETESRLPPKLLKVASGAGKALYARGYGYNVLPIPQKILLQANFARREVHGPRPRRRNRRPPRRNKRPPPDYASRYQDYRPVRKRRPPRYPDPPDYHEQDLDEEFEYEDHSNKEFEDFVSKHSELYTKGYNTRTKPRRHRDEEAAYTENSGSIYVRKPLKNYRPSTKLYSAAIGYRLKQPREEQDYDDEEEDEDNYYLKGNKRGRYKLEDSYRDTEDEDDEYRPYSFRKNPPRNWNPDDFYHDRKYDAKQQKVRQSGGKLNDQTRQPMEFGGKWNSNPEKETILEDSNKRKLQPDGNNWRVIPDRNRWKNIEQQNSQKSKRWKEPGTVSNGEWGVTNAKEEEDWKEPDIITSHNAAKWDGTRAIESLQEEQKKDWVKEHSVGYGIEIEGGKKNKRVEGEPDVVYGQAGNSKPRVPEVGNASRAYSRPEVRYEQGGYSKPNIPDFGYGRGIKVLGKSQPGRHLYQS